MLPYRHTEVGREERKRVRERKRWRERERERKPQEFYMYYAAEKP